MFRAKFEIAAMGTIALWTHLLEVGTEWRGGMCYHSRYEHRRNWGRIIGGEGDVDHTYS